MVNGLGLVVGKYSREFAGGLGCGEEREVGGVLVGRHAEAVGGGTDLLVAGTFGCHRRFLCPILSERSARPWTISPRREHSRRWSPLQAVRLPWGKEVLEWSLLVSLKLTSLAIRAGRRTYWEERGGRGAGGSPALMLT
jgi:hypothetical protein